LAFSRAAQGRIHRAWAPGAPLKRPPGVGCNAGLGLVVLEEYHSGVDLQFTAVFRKVPEGYIGFIEELPGANTQGATLEEARANLHEAVEMVLQANRELIEDASTGAEVIREPFKVSA
jgi:predicted RNase H-like HicB family nuclease